jgi:hypothetical protein
MQEKPIPRDMDKKVNYVENPNSSKQRMLGSKQYIKFLLCGWHASLGCRADFGTPFGKVALQDALH